MIPLSSSKVNSDRSLVCAVVNEWLHSSLTEAFPGQFSGNTSPNKPAPTTPLAEVPLVNHQDEMLHLKPKSSQQYAATSTSSMKNVVNTGEAYLYDDLVGDVWRVDLKDVCFDDQGDDAVVNSSSANGRRSTTSKSEIEGSYLGIEEILMFLRKVT
jgi:hypothetical protein